VTAIVDPGEYPPVDPRAYRLLRERPWLALGEAMSAISAIGLLVCMFALRWYGTVGPARGPEGSGRTSAENAWHSLAVIRWLMLVTIVVALSSLGLHAAQHARSKRTETAALVVALATLTAVLLLFRLLLDPPSPGAIVDVKFGGFLGLICSMGIVLGAFDAFRDERALRTARRGPA